jgi:hypothetical protein
MILPALSIPDTIMEYLPQARDWAEQAGKTGLVSIGVVGQSVHVLPGFLDSIEVSSALMEDSVPQEGKSGSIKIVHGWKDCDVSITLLLLDIPAINYTKGQVTPHISRYDCLAEIVGTFKYMTDGKPHIYTVHHPHLAAWGGQQFIFTGLKTSESRSKRIITCTLDFDEYDSTTGKSQDRQIGVPVIEPSAEAEPYIPDTTRAGLGELEAKHGKR